MSARESRPATPHARDRHRHTVRARWCLLPSSGRRAATSSRRAPRAAMAPAPPLSARPGEQGGQDEGGRGDGEAGPQARPARPPDVPDRASRAAASGRTVLRWPSHGNAGSGCTGSCNATTARIRTCRSACNAASIASPTPYGVCLDGAAPADPVPRGRQAGTTATY